MGRILIAIFTVVASFMLVESLTCNKCSFSLAGLCLSSSNENCATNTSVCFTAKMSFPQLSSFAGFNFQGCREPSGCNSTTNSTSLLGVTTQTQIDCCQTDKCNPTQTSGAPSTKMTFAAAAGVAALASMWGSVL